MKRITITAALLLATSSACAHAKTNPRRAIRIAKRALVGIDIALEQLQPLVDEATDTRIAKCEGEPPGPRRDACLGIFAKEVEPIANKAGAIYDGLVTALDELGAVWTELEALRAASKQEVR